MTPIRHSAHCLVFPLLLATAFVGCADKQSEGAAEQLATRSTPAQFPTNDAANGDADLEEIGDYRLTMDDLRKWSSIVAEANQIDYTQSASREISDNPSIDDLEGLYSENPQARALIENGGLDIRDFVVITFTMMHAGFAQFSIDQGANPDSVAKEMNVSLANLKFLKDHQNEIAQLQKNNAAPK